MNTFLTMLSRLPCGRPTESENLPKNQLHNPINLIWNGASAAETAQMVQGVRLFQYYIHLS